jgi:signal transduction histidine kinase/CheY-like chemotaxis protein/HPt (histidine-containing phosphotransfer) domain-containing protein
MLTSHPAPKPLTPLQLFACISAAAIASTVLFGWATDNASMTKVFSSSIAMNPMTGVCLLAMSWAILLRSPRTAGLFYALAAAAILVGSTKLLQLALGVPGGIDQLLFADRLAGVQGAQNRMAPNTAFALATLGLGLLTSRLRDPRALIVSQIMCLVAAGTALAAMVGYLLDVVALYQVHMNIAMALPTAMALLILSAAIVSFNSDSGLMRVLRDPGPAGSLARIALPIALVVPVIVGMLGLIGQRAGYYGTEAAVVIELIANVTVNFVLVGGCTVALFRSDAERHQREALLTRSEKQFRQAEDAGHVGYWKMELPSRAVQWSNGLLRICGLQEGVAPDVETALAIYHPDDAPLVRAAVAKAEELGTEWELKCRICHPDGSLRYVETHGLCERNEAGETTEVFVVTSDVTDLEIARRDAEAAKATTASFLTNMSHEIRTPMNGIMGFVELLLGSELDGVQRRHLTLIQNSANALLKLLNDILDISKIDSGRLEIVETRYNVRHGIEQCVRLMTPMAEQKRLALSLSIDEDFPAHLTIDGLRLRQIILNLIGNAIKFTHRGFISVVIEKGTGANGTATLHASVEDSGIGIHPDRRATIFEAFVQAELTTTRRFGGSGLGLSISRQLAEMMHGSIEVDSVLGKGTTMTLVLPMIEASESKAAHVAMERTPEVAGEVAPPAPEFRPASILLVEDIDINQELFTEMLVRLGHKFQIAPDGAVAVEMAKRLLSEPDSWDMILMDLQMPVMDGLTATQAIRAFGGRAATIPIIALTASAFEEERRQCEASGMNDHLAKPVGIESLRRMIDRWQGTGPMSAAAEEEEEEPQPARSASLNQRVKARLQSSADRLAEIVEEVLGTGPDEQKALMVEAGKIAHMLAGTAGMVGYPAAGEIASSTEAKIASYVEVGSAAALMTAVTAIEELVAALTDGQSSTPEAPQAQTA